MDDLKVRFCGTTDVVLHSRDIRKQQKDFRFLWNPERRAAFYEAINNLVGQLDFTIIAVAIMKREHLSQYGYNAKHPYHLTLELMLERFAFMIGDGGASSDGHIIAESRGEAEDRLLKKSSSA